MRKKSFLIFSVILQSLFVTTVCLAQNTAKEPAPPSVEGERSWEQILIDKNIAVSEWFDSLAEGIDLFLVGKKVTKRHNDSSLRIENATYYKEFEEPKNVTVLAVIPKFPNLEDYWQFKFTSYDERQDSRGVQNNYLRQRPREQNYGASVGLFQKLGDIRVAFQPRIELNDPLEIAHSLSFESVAKMRNFEVNPKLEFFATANRGTGIFQALNFNFQLTQIYSLTFLNEGEYIEKLHEFTENNGFVIGQYLTETSSMAYSLVFNSFNKPKYHLRSFGLAASYNQLLYKKILDMQITPHLDFSEEIKFRRQAGLTFTLILHF